MSARDCAKRRYPDLVAAQVALAVLQRKDDGRHVERRIYFCEQCQSHHLTSQTRAQHQSAIERADFHRKRHA